MDQTYRVVRLMKNQLYPTYQLHAYMANKKTAPRDGLRLAGLVTMEWLRQRLGDHVPEELLHLPEPAAYLTADDSCLPSVHINAGFLIDIVSLPEQGIWTLQLTEPDLGSDPGNPEQARQPIPGRVIETNVGYKIVGSQLECGFQTVISDPEGTPLAEVYRLAFVRRLVDHPDFGLKQLTKLTHEAAQISTVDQAKSVISVWRDRENQLPCVVFTRYREEQQTGLLPTLELSDSLRGPRMPQLPLKPGPVLQDKPPEVPYDIAAFVKYGVTFFRSYVLDDALFERFTAMAGVSAQRGDVLIFEPPCCGKRVRTLAYKPSAARRAEQLERLREELYSYSRGREVPFGSIRFLSAAREDLLRHSADAVEQSAETSELWEEKLAQNDARWQEKLQEKEQTCQALTEQLERQRQYQQRIEREKEQLRKDIADERQRMQQLLADKDEDIAYLKRRLSQPEEHDRVAAWVEKNFAGRLLLHPKAKALLEDKGARAVNVSLICDALDFLATDYWERRYARISTEEMNSRCSEKYGRPFEVKPTGTTTIEFTPAQYKVKYFPGAAGKPVESPLDYHLSVGNDPENLLRIYFLHDDEKKLIVVGSLPRHLRAVTIK